MDLLRIYNKVIEMGGHEAVNRDKGWKYVCNLYVFPPTCTNAAYAMKSIYMKYVSCYEDVYYWKNDLSIEESRQTHAKYSQRRTPGRKRKFSESNPSKISYESDDLRKMSLRKRASSRMDVDMNSSLLYNKKQLLFSPNSNELANISAFENSGLVDSKTSSFERGSDIYSNKNVISDDYVRYNSSQNNVSSPQISYRAGVPPYDKNIISQRMGSGVKPYPAHNNFLTNQASLNKAGTLFDKGSITKHLSEVLDGSFLNAYDFLGGARSRIVLALDSGLPNEIEWASKQLLRFSAECSEEYIVEAMSPFLLDSILLHLKNCRNGLRYDVMEHNLVVKTGYMDFDNRGDFDSREAYNQNIKESEFHKMESTVFQNGSFHWKNSISELASNLILSLRNLSAINVRNAIFFSRDDRLLDETILWLNSYKDIWNIGTEAAGYIVELLEILVECCNDSDIPSFEPLFGVMSEIFLKADDSHLIILSASYLYKYLIRTNSRSNSPTFKRTILHVTSDKKTNRKLVHKCLEMLMVIKISDNGMIETISGLLSQMMRAECHSMIFFKEDSKNTQFVCWESSLPDYFDRDLTNCLKIWYKKYDFLLNNSDFAVLEFSENQKTTHRKNDLKLGFYEDIFSLDSVCRQGSGRKTAVAIEKDDNETISDVSAENDFNLNIVSQNLSAMFRLILELCAWSVSLLKITNHKSANEELLRVLSIGFYKSSSRPNLDTETPTNPPGPEMNTRQENQKILSQEQEGIFSPFSTSEKSNSQQGKPSERYSDLFLNDELRESLTDIAIILRSPEAKSFLAAFHAN
ncbi:hypothetical protein BB559_000941 [Furculomyces boomerangus]|uniref:ARID domain-containing protein n=2 Tax=Harpellales TaxID=61421 RepID=A0A2T9Z3R2_9FUNG|nr:hypothetical protein BB559_000941 [Furculomyces boomerangus]